MNLTHYKQTAIFIPLLTFLCCNSATSEREQQARNEIIAEFEQLKIAEELIKNNQHADAVRLTDKIIATSTESENIGRAYGLKSMVFYRDKNYQNALDNSLKSISYKEYDIYGDRVRALSLFRLGRYSEALPHLTNELEITEIAQFKDPELYYALGISYYRLGDKLMGCLYLRKSIEHGNKQAINEFAQLCDL
jgi:tetratricopeptide (TPR) repeat protein